MILQEQLINKIKIDKYKKTVVNNKKMKISKANAKTTFFFQILDK